MTRPTTFAFVLLTTLMPACGDSGPPLHPVAGRVLIDGEPRPMVRVQFWHQDASVEGNFKSPVGITDAEGDFRLSTLGDADGALAGEYVVTFEWLSGNDLDAFDKFDGKYVDPKRSRHRATVTPGTNTLEPFVLEGGPGVRDLPPRTPAR